MVIWIFGIMLYLDVKLAMVSLALIPPMALAINYFRGKARHTYRQNPAYGSRASTPI